ncbi:Cyclophilin type peptidyl-prolyl cis-trans isomerase/CLD [uncultured archaeon]|nr:Cyclophilin type peptidyl-prolyl cis-trans isomerase/CLD [uncultured archaeon]
MLNKKTIFITAGIVLVLIIGAIFMVNTNQPTKVSLETNYGTIVIQLREDMPITSGNFENLVKKGTYDGTIFHRIIDGFMIQGGDPTGTGYGDRRIPMIKDEFNGVQKNNRGTIAMANAGPNTGSSQFFINLVNNNFLDGKHPVFGEVVEGMDVVDKIAKVQTNSQDRPLQNVTILKASII